MNNETLCRHVGESGGYDDCKLGLTTMDCDEEFSSWYEQHEGDKNDKSTIK